MISALKFKNLLKGFLLLILHTLISLPCFLKIYCSTLRSLTLLIVQMLNQNSRWNNFSLLVFSFHLPNSVLPGSFILDPPCLQEISWFWGASHISAQETPAFDILKSLAVQTSSDSHLISQAIHISYSHPYKIMRAFKTRYSSIWGQKNIWWFCQLGVDIVEFNEISFGGVLKGKARFCSMLTNGSWRLKKIFIKMGKTEYTHRWRKKKNSKEGKVLTK